MLLKYAEQYRKLGLNIAYYRKLRGYSQEKLAELAGISRVHISKVEIAEGTVSLDLLFVLADVMQVEPWKLLQDKE